MADATSQSATTPTAQQDASAAVRVFAIPELLEAILIHLFDDEALFESKAAASLIIAKRVSKTFKYTIDDSKKLQHLAFLDEKPSASPIIDRIQRPSLTITPHNVGINNSIRMLCEGKVFQSPHRHEDYFELTKMTRPLASCELDTVWLEFHRRSTWLGKKKVTKYIKHEASCLDMRIADPGVKVHITAYPLKANPVRTYYDLYMLEPTEGRVEEGATLGELVGWLGLWAKNQAHESDLVDVEERRWRRL